MSGLSFPTASAIAHALLAHRRATTSDLSFWNGYSSLHAKTFAAECTGDLARIDNALRDFQAAAPPSISLFLKMKIELIHPTVTAPQPSNQDAA